MLCTMSTQLCYVVYHVQPIVIVALGLRHFDDLSSCPIISMIDLIVLDLELVG